MTQNNNGIPLSFSHNLSPIRLVELPPALLSLLSNADSPPTLHIKASSAPGIVNSTTNHAVLTTPTQTYNLRQVYSSNSILLLRPSPDNSLTIVSSANSYMELLPTTPSTTPLLTSHIPIFPPPTPFTPTLTRSSLLSSLPISEAEFNNCWNNLCCFSCPEGYAYRPQPSTILNTLKAIEIVQHFGDGVDLGAFFPEEIVKAIDQYYASLSDEDDDDDDEENLQPQNCIPGLVEAVVFAVSRNGCRSGREDQLAIDEDIFMAWVGRLILEDWAVKGKGDMLYASFMQKWKKEVPDWSSSVNIGLKLIEGWYILPTPSTIRFAPGGNSPAAEAAETQKTQKKNKWHEKLGKGKRR